MTSMLAYDRSHTEAEKLVKEVERHPILYDPTVRGYKDRVKVEAEWQAVANYMGLTANDARKRWQNLRGSYSRSRNSQGGKKPLFYLMHQMSFLEPHMKQNPRSDFVSLPEEMGDTHGSLPAWMLPVSPPEPPEKPDMKDIERVSPVLPAMSDATPFSHVTPAASHVTPATLANYIFPPTTPASPVTSERQFKRSAPMPDSSDGDIDFRELAARFLESKMQKLDTDPDLESLKGLLPHMGALTKRNKRVFLRRIYNLVFEMLEEQEAENESMKSDND